jgi:hypothetical protein
MGLPEFKTLNVGYFEKFFHRKETFLLILKRNLCILCLVTPDIRAFIEEESLRFWREKRYRNKLMN